MVICRDLAANFRLGEACSEPAATVIQHSEGCSYPLCDTHGDMLEERWNKDVGTTSRRPCTEGDMPGGLW